MSFDISRLSKTKSDQLNADDLLSGSITVTITDMYEYSDPKQPVGCEIGQGHQPWKPCLTMRKLLMNIWGEGSDDWMGKSLTLFNDPTVLWAGKEDGGVRVSHVSHINKDTTVNLMIRKGKRKPYTVKPLIMTLPPVTQPDLDSMLPKMKTMIEKGERTPTDIINNMQKKGVLSPAQKEQIITLGNVPAIEENEEEDL
jgi:hypothetical protein